MATASLIRFLSRSRSWTNSAWLPSAAAGAAVCAGTLCLASPSTRSPARCEPGGAALSREVSSKYIQLAKRTDSGNDRLLFGIPKKGRLFEKVNNILGGSGIEYHRQARLDIANCTDLPVTLVFLPACDIPTYVGEGDVDLGITGEDMVAECGVDVNVLMQLGFGKCNLSVQGPKDAKLKPEDLAGKRIVTSFPNVTRKYFEQITDSGDTVKIKCISGSVEAAIGLGLADGIVDLVETGTTMRAAGLEEVSVILKSQSVLIANPHTRHHELIDVIKKRLEGYLVAQSWVMLTYNVHRMNLRAAQAITPGKRSPSVTVLEEANWVAVSALVPKAKAAEVMDGLEAVGARDILMTALLSTRMS